METISQKAWSIVRAMQDNSEDDIHKALVEIATEQDRIARQEERERCIKAAQDVYCDITCNHRCDFTQRCQIMWEIRKAMEGGES